MFSTSPYNIPTNQIRPATNQVNISGGMGGANRNDAFAAFSRLYTPFLQSQAKMLGEMQAPPEGGAIIGGKTQPVYTAGPNDINNALMSMFQRAEDIGTMSRYGGFSPATRRSPIWG